MSLNSLPAIGTWLEEIAALEAPLRPARLLEMQELTRTHGGCGSMHTANGLPCRRPPKAGYPVCRKHGERAPQTVAKAERLLAIARMPAIETILDELDQFQEQTCVTCGYPSHSLKERKHIAAVSFKLLDRTGFGPRSTIDLNARKLDDKTLDVTQLTDQEFLELNGMLDQMEDFRTRVQARLAAGVLEAERVQGTDVQEGEAREVKALGSEGTGDDHPHPDQAAPGGSSGGGPGVVPDRG